MPTPRPPVDPMPILGPDPDPIGAPAVGPGGGTGVFFDNPVINELAEHTGQIGDELSGAIRRVSGSLVEAGQQSGWAIGKALADCADGWELELLGTGKAVREVGDKLRACADNYATTENAIRDNFLGVMRGGKQMQFNERGASNGAQWI